MSSPGPSSPQTPRRGRRGSVIGLFDSTSPSRGSTRLTPVKTTSTVASSVKKSLLRGTFRKGWPPSVRGRQLFRSIRGAPPQIAPSFTLTMSDLYRLYGDKWATNHSLLDEPADLSVEFKEMMAVMDEVQALLNEHKSGGDLISQALLREMAYVVYGSNVKARKGLGLDETLKICMKIFEGAVGVEYDERTEEYQAKLEAFIKNNLGVGQGDPVHAIRSRAEVVQHAAAFQHMVNCFVRLEMPMSEQLIKDTHAILVKDASGEGAGILSSKSFGGMWRSEDVYVGTQRFPRPAKIPGAMASVVKQLANELEHAEKVGKLDPIALSAKYSDLIVNIHPFRDGNGRMCRLILNTILLKYAGIVVNVGEHDQNRDEYIDTARESRELGGHPGALATLVLKEATKSYRKIRDFVKKNP